MATTPAPWLADLDDDWAPSNTPQTEPKPHFTSLGPEFESASLRRTHSDSSHHSSMSRRPLSEIAPNAGNETAPQAGSIRSTTSARSIVHQDTMARRAKSSSPPKKPLTLEWQRRIIEGEVGYGDQTDLFGPSGLENMFATPTKSSPLARQKPGISPFARFKPVTQMPSSPPQWGSSPDTAAANFNPTDDLGQTETLSQLDSDHAEQSIESQGGSPAIFNQSRATCSVAAKPDVRTVSGQTDLGNEDFSPVFISKHTTWKGDVDYAPLSSDMARLVNSTSSREHHVPATASHREAPEVSHLEHTVPEVSLPDDLPTGTPPAARLGPFVSTQRGGLSDQGSFMHRAPSPSSDRPVSVSIQEPHGHARTRSDPSAAIGTATDHSPDHKAMSSPLISHQSPQHLSPRPPTSPLKLFGAHDTFTNRKLLRRISELEITRDSSVPEARSPSSNRHNAAHVLDRYREPDSSCPITRSRSDSRRSFVEEMQNDYDRPINTTCPDQSCNFDLSDDDENSFEGSPPPDIVPPGALTPSGWQIPKSSNLSAEKYGTKRKLSQRSTAKSRPGQVVEPEIATVQGSVCVKRPQDSPCKARTPKRRRTVHQQELEQMALSSDSSRLQHTQKMVSHNDGQELNSSELPDEQSSPRRQTEKQSEIADATAEFVSDPPRLQALQEQIEASALLGSEDQAAEARNIASKVAAFTINASRSGSDAVRKRSITTQDFLDEAMQIMAVIRARVGPQNGLASVEEFEDEDCQTSIASVRHGHDRDSPQPWSAPESCAGTINGWRPRRDLQQDPRVVSQLRRFADKDDHDIVDATLPALRDQSLVDDEDVEADFDTAQFSDIRITGPKHVMRRMSTVSHDGRIETVDSEFYVDDYPTGKSADSNGSRRSDNVATLAPETVAHLIPAEVAGMIFDTAQKKWIRIKRARSASRVETYSRTHSLVASDDDPFGNIPDLTVDEMREIERAGLQAATVTGRAVTVNPAGFSGLRNIEPADFSSSTNPTKMSAFASSAPQPETRATSWGTQQYGKSTAPRGQQPRQHASHQSQEKRTYSSQLEFSETGHDHDYEDDLTEELPTLPEEDNPESSTPRRHGELSILAELPDKRLVSVSLSVKKPAPVAKRYKDNSIAPYAALQSPNVYLSDLPDFTVHQIDEVKPSEIALAQRIAGRTVDSVENPYAMAINDMVRSLTDAEPKEPHWEDIKHLTLSNKSLGSLHGLDEFCERLQALDISSNAIAHVEGAPPSTRWLSAASNNLTSLTAWHHLHNLQFLDISDNDMDNLLGLSDLCHLRHLRVNNNNLTSLDGITDLDGLITLEVRGNLITSVGFSDAHMKSLENLDLSCNGMTSCQNVSLLPSLKRLCLDNNKLSSLTLSDGDQSSSTSLLELCIQNNHLKTIDVAGLPMLQHLDISQNRLQGISGLDELEHLDTLLINGQRQMEGQVSIVQSVLGQPLHARCVRLSHNTIPILSLPGSLYSIRSLDLSHCGLATLPDDFGVQLSNVTLLNLDFNSLKDVRQLVNLTCLTELHVAGNRISRLRQTMATFAAIPTLQLVDSRENPFTHGFYVPRTTELSTQLTVPSESNVSKEHTPTAKQAKELFRADMLPAISPEADKAHMVKLDEDTRLRRRVYELLCTTGCKALQVLDGLPLRRDEITTKDATWRRLVELGVLKKSAQAAAPAGLDAGLAGLAPACVDAVGG